MGITVSGAKPARVWALIEASDGGVFRSDDAGATWTLVNNQNKLRQGAWYYDKLFADPKDSNVLGAVNTSLFRSKDDGRAFLHTPDPHGATHNLRFPSPTPAGLSDTREGL